MSTKMPRFSYLVITVSMKQRTRRFTSLFSFVLHAGLQTTMLSPRQLKPQSQLSRQCDFTFFNFSLTNRGSDYSRAYMASTESQ